MNRSTLVDSHVHLHAYPDYANLLARAAMAGVSTVVAVGIDLPTSHWNVTVARERPDVIAAVGLHPVHLRPGIDVNLLPDLELMARDSVVRVIGEIGLDTIDGQMDLERQIQVFAEMLALASHVRKPVNLHVRGAVEPALDLIRASGIVEVGAVGHYFVGDTAEVRRLLDLGLVISVGKPVSRPANVALREAVRVIPRDRLLLETDSYPLPGRLTEPADLPVVARAVAEIRHCSVDAVVSASTELFARLVGINIA